MGVKKGTVTGSSITTNKNGLLPVIMLQVMITDPEDIQSIQFVSQSGEDTRPEDGAEVYIINIGSSFKIAVASDDRVVPTSEKGDKKFYSLENGIKKSFVNILKSGIVEVNGNGDFLVRYTALEAALTLFATSINSAIESAIKGHKHAGVTAGSDNSAMGDGNFNQAVVNIVLAKVLEVKTS